MFRKVLCVARSGLNLVLRRHSGPLLHRLRCARVAPDRVHWTKRCVSQVHQLSWISPPATRYTTTPSWSPPQLSTATTRSPSAKRYLKSRSRGADPFSHFSFSHSLYSEPPQIAGK